MIVGSSSQDPRYQALEYPQRPQTHARFPAPTQRAHNALALAIITTGEMMGGEEGVPPLVEGQDLPAMGAMVGPSEGVKIEEGNDNNNNEVAVAADVPAPKNELPKDDIKFPDVPATTLPLRLLDGGCPLLRPLGA